MSKYRKWFKRRWGHSPVLPITSHPSQLSIHFTRRMWALFSLPGCRDPRLLLLKQTKSVKCNTKVPMLYQEESIRQLPRLLLLVTMVSLTKTVRILKRFQDRVLTKSWAASSRHSLDRGASRTSGRKKSAFRKMNPKRSKWVLILAQVRTQSPTRPSLPRSIA